MSGGQLSGESVADQTIQSLINLRALPKPAAQFGGETGVSTIEVFARGFITTLEQRVYNQTANTGNQSLSSQIRDVIELKYEDVAPASLHDGLESWWSLDEESTGAGAISRLDSHGANDLTDNGTTPSTDGKVGLATQHTNAVPDWLSHVSNTSLQAGDIDFSFACWVWLDNKATSQMIIGKDNNVAGEREYYLKYQVAGVDRFQVAIFRPVDAFTLLDANTLGAPAIGTWYFVVFWHDATANTLNIQVNDGGIDSVATGGALQAASAAEFQIGRREFAGAQEPLDGRVDEVAFAKRIWTTAEKTAMYNAGVGIPYTDIGRSVYVSGVGQFIESIETEANTTPVTQEYDMDRKASSIVTDLPRLGDSKANRWLLDCYGRDCTGVRGRRARLHQASPVLPPE